MRHAGQCPYGGGTKDRDFTVKNSRTRWERGSFKLCAIGLCYCKRLKDKGAEALVEPSELDQRAMM